MANVIKKLFDSLDFGKDSYAVYLEETDGDGIHADLSEVTSDVFRQVEDFGGTMPAWITPELLQEAIKNGLAAAHATLLANQPA